MCNGLEQRLKASQNMRLSLDFVTDDQFDQKFQKIGCFGQFLSPKLKHWAQNKSRQAWIQKFVYGQIFGHKGGLRELIGQGGFEFVFHSLRNIFGTLYHRDKYGLNFHKFLSISSSEKSENNT